MGERFGRYVLEELLGRGGMAEVYRAHVDDGGFQKTVCIKRILPELVEAPGFADMLRDEASLHARLSHTNLVQAFDFGAGDGRLYIAMELVDGVSLARILHVLRATGVAFPRSRALHIAICMCRGLHAAHGATGADGRPLALIHRDVSPHNVLLGIDGAIKVSDFGVARAGERLTRTRVGTVKGKPNYMAPEQARAAACDQRVDQFACAAVLWEMLAGRPLFGGRTIMSVLKRVIECDVPSLSELRSAIPASLDDVVRRALARDPGGRYPDMAAFERALDGELVKLGATLSDIDTRVLVRHTRETEPILTAAPAQARSLSNEVVGGLDGPEAEDTVDGAPLHATSAEGVYARPTPPPTKPAPAPAPTRPRKR